jgi:CheY-like chemotaxis protein
VLFIGNLSDAASSVQPGTHAASLATSADRRLAAHFAPGQAEQAPSLAAARQRLGDQNQAPCEVIVLCEPRPGIWSDREVNALRMLAPLARVVRLSGSLCEGQARSGRPARGTWNVPWHQWPAFVARELSADEPQHSSRWMLPLTATPDEQALATYQPSPRLGRGHVAILSGSAAAAAALAGTCHSAGYTTTRNDPQSSTVKRGAIALLWDTTAEALADAPGVARLKATHAAAPILALVGFPRAEDVAAAGRAGIAAVLAKPLDTDELLWRLARLSVGQAVE